jgi:hypothetical protein
MGGYDLLGDRDVDRIDDRLDPRWRGLHLLPAEATRF